MDMAKRIFSVILLIAMMLCMFSFAGCGSSNKKTYKCAYCGHVMKGAYYDYIDGRYACRSCSKALRY